MANKLSIYGANEAVSLTDKVNKLINSGLTFGVGVANGEQLAQYAGKDDSKLRFVAVEGTGSGIVFAGGNVVSSKILDITTNAQVATGQVVDGTWVPATAEEHATDKPATKVTVKWFGEKVDQTDGVTKTQIWETEFDIVDKATVAGMITKLNDDVLAQINNLIRDISILNTSVNNIENYLNSSSNITGGAAITVNPTDDDGFTRYDVNVNVDNNTVKIVDNKLVTSMFKIAKLEETDDGYDSNFASQYSLAIQKPGSTKFELVGDTINIMKDFLLKDAHVCTFDMKKADDGSYVKIEWDPEGAYNEGGLVTEDTPAYADLNNGQYEKAPLGKGIKLGHTYLHMILNTKDNDEALKDSSGNIQGGQSVDNSLNYANDQLTDVYLDFTEIFKTFTGDNTYITINSNGVISLKPDAVKNYINGNILGGSITLTDKIEEIDTSIAELKSILNTSIEERLDTLDSSVNKIESSYLSDVSLVAPSLTNEQFNSVTVTKTENGTETTVSVDVANEKYYTALNNALETLQSNDEYLASLLTWKNLD